MTVPKKKPVTDPILVVIQLTGANDYLNTVVPYGEPLYYDNRPTVNVPPEQVIPIDSQVKPTPPCICNPSLATWT